MPGQNIADWNVSTLVKFVREMFEKDPPLTLTNLTVEELRVVKKLTVDERSVFSGVKFHQVGRPGEPAFAGVWVNFGSPHAAAGYWKDPTGIVHLQGRVMSGVLNTKAFTLPPGYRPLSEHTFPVVSNGALGVLRLPTDGQVIPVSGSNASFQFDGVQFRAA